MKTLARNIKFPLRLLTSIFFLCCVMTSIHWCLAQPPSFGNPYHPLQKQEYKYTSESGLHYMFQDAQGFLWGTGREAKLIRFDGREIRYFSVVSEDSTAHSGGRLWASGSEFIQDKTGKIWIKGAGKMLERYDPETERFSNFYQRLNEMTEGELFKFHDIHEDLEGNIWICSQWVLFKYNIIEDKVFSFDLPAYGELVFEDNKGNIWVNVVHDYSSNALYQLDLRSGIFTNRLDISLLQQPPIGWSRKDQALILEEEQNILLLIGGSLYLFYPDNNQILPIPKTKTNDCFVSTLFQKDSLILVGTFRNFVFQFFPQTSSLNLFSGTLERGTEAGFIPNIFQSKDDILWINRPDGLFKLVPKIANLKVVRGPRKPASVQFEETMFTFNGEAYFDSLSSLVPVRETDPSFSYLDTRIPVINNQQMVARQFEEDKDGNMWMAACWKTTKDIFVFIRQFDTEGKKVNDFSFKAHKAWLREASIEPDTIILSYNHFLKDIIMDHSGGLWLGTTEFLSRFDTHTGEIQQYIHRSDSLSPINGSLRTFFIDRKNQLWTGSGRAGLRKLDQRTGKWASYELSKLKIKNLKNKINTIFEDSIGTIWIGSGVGLISLDELSGSFKEYNGNGLVLQSNISKIFEDYQKNLWISSWSFLARYYQEEERFIPFTDNDGVGGISSYYQRVYRDNDHYIFLTKSGRSVAYFHPDSLIIDKRVPPIVFTDFQLGNKTIRSGDSLGILQKSLDFTESIALNYEQNDFTIRYIAPEYIYPNETFYATQLEGFHDDWQEVGTKRESRYTNLSPGKYVFKVKVQNHHGFWSQTPRTLKITILPPWYRTWWAYTIWTALILGSIFSLYRFQLHRQLEKAESQRLKELDLAKSRLYTNITHEFRTPLTVILGMIDQMKADPKNWFSEGAALIKRNGKLLLNLVNQLLDLSKLESGQMPLNWVSGDIVAFLQYLTESFHSYADSKDIRLHFASDFKQLEMDYDPEKMQSIVTNLLSNAVKYTPAGGDVYLDVRKPDAGENAMLMRVRDNGVGIAAKDLPHIFDRFYQVDATATRRGEGVGIGLSLTRELVKLMDGDISVESEVGKGTTFNLLLPVKQVASKVSPSEMANLPPPIAETVLVETPNTPSKPDLPRSELPLVLLIEDNADVVTYLASFLSGEYQIATAANGQEGIEKAIALIPDLIVSDVMMPEKDGFEVCATLKADERTSHIPIILLTAKSGQPAKLEGLSHGADAYLAKPFDKQELLVRIEKLIELRRHLQERFKSAAALLDISKKTAADEDELFLQKMVGIVEANLSDENFGLPELCRKATLSRSQLFRKLKALTGKSTTHFIRSIRLAKSKALLETTGLSVSEVCYETGFSNPAYFSRVFVEEFGLAPSEVGKTR